MTTRQLIWMTLPYAAAFVALIYFTRATPRRVTGAVIGAAVVAWLVLGTIALAERMGLWRVPLEPSPVFLGLLCLSLVVSCAPLYLVTWRIARRFGGRGIAAVLV
ncbi:MAG: hypothetical protein ACREJC_03345, partial [Tepidisphaeraceae bacterium]